MRREHASISADVLDSLASCMDGSRPFHITVLAAKANLPHDRLRVYLDELAAIGLLTLGPDPVLTTKGRQFLECYYVWGRVQELYGLHPHPSHDKPPSWEIVHLSTHLDKDLGAFAPHP
jgi:predicted transcriptional regulator